MISYGLLGMPLFLLTCAKISFLLAEMFIFIYKSLLCCPCHTYSAYKASKENQSIQVTKEDQKNFAKNIDQEETDLYDENEDDEEAQVRIPLIMIICMRIVFKFSFQAIIEF